MYCALFSSIFFDQVRELNRGAATGLGETGMNPGSWIFFLWQKRG
jgi:hypothetical protein